MSAPASFQSDRDRRLDEAVAEYLEAIDAGRRPDPAHWLNRFPDLAPELERFFAGQEQVRSLLGSLVSPPAADDPTPPSAVCPPGAELRALGDYELIEEIARGGMGVVYRARDTRLGRIVALKMIIAGRLASATDVQRFLREAEAAANLDHPNIVPIYEVGEHAGQPYFTMKLIEGGSLAQQVERLRRDPRATARLLAAVARAVHHAHQRGLLHRDLKPGNVLVDAEGEPHLTDFGLARRLGGDGGMTRTGTAVGTPSYMAPEQATDPRATTTAADVYSLGAMLYELLTGQPPFRAEHALETLRLLLEGDPAPPRALDPRIDRDLETICLKCLDRNPGRRYASAAELADDLDRYLRGEPVHARRSGLVERLWRWARRRPVVAALLLSLLAGTCLVTWQWWRAESHLAQLAEQYARAEREWTRAEQERARADEGFQHAHQAVNEFCTRVSEGRMRDLPGVQSERQALLRSALAYFERFLRERADDPALRRELAATHFRIGTIATLLGPKAQALDAFDRAEAIYNDLLSEDPGNFDLRSALAETHLRRGIVYQGTSRAADAAAAFEEAARRYEALLEERPTQGGLKNGTAAAYNNLGNAHRAAGRLPSAVECFRRAAALQADLTRRDPKSAHYRANYALTLSNLGDVESTAGNRKEALKLLEQALALQEKLVEDDFFNFHYQQDLAKTRRQLAAQMNAIGKFDGAQALLEQSQTALERLARTEPLIPSLKSELAIGCRQLGHHYRSRNKLKEALAQYDRSLAIMEALSREHPEVPAYRNDVAKSHFDRATIFERQRKWNDAAAAYGAAAALRRDLVAANPQDLTFIADLALTLGNEAASLFNAGRRDEALTAIRESVRLHRTVAAAVPEVPRHRGMLGSACALQARLAADKGFADEAIAVARERCKIGTGRANELYGLAASLASLAGKAVAEKQQAADLSIATLRDAVAAGFQDGARVRKDAAFTAVRDRSDFAAILADLPAAKDP